MTRFLCLLLCIYYCCHLFSGSCVDATVYLDEQFQSLDSWQIATAIADTGEQYGRVQLAAGRFPAQPDNLALQTVDNERHYALYRPVQQKTPPNFSTLLVQFTVRHEQNIDCGGGYLKLLSDPVVAFNANSSYRVMFGPDICGMQRQVRLQLHHPTGYLSLRRRIVPPADQLTHHYRLILRANDLYSVWIDEMEEASGNIWHDFDGVPPRTIPDPYAVKPADWVEEATLSVAEGSVDAEPEFIPEPGARRPVDWEDDVDGEWIAPMLENPRFQRQPRRVANPQYRGPWQPPHIDNPAYAAVVKQPLFNYSITHVGFELWQVKAGTLFDDILVTDDETYAREYTERTFTALRPLERAAKYRLDEEEEAALLAESDDIDFHDSL